MCRGLLPDPAGVCRRKSRRGRLAREAGEEGERGERSGRRQRLPRTGACGPCGSALVPPATSAEPREGTGRAAVRRFRVACRRIGPWVAPRPGRRRGVEFERGGGAGASRRRRVEVVGRLRVEDPLGRETTSGGRPVGEFVAGSSGRTDRTDVVSRTGCAPTGGRSERGSSCGLEAATRIPTSLPSVEPGRRVGKSAAKWRNSRGGGDGP
jgi:hypothetical protein